ncbi:MAG: type II toxin-antitoxin system mRNA interferase toxin, RelE/StbE family [Candidatus Levybacteria bacterium]|nr:type II toxin-antitoxin system mRNA interferase toxin, RelE/StbE family [Candidatus Levybacteria bacterium]
MKEESEPLIEFSDNFNKQRKAAPKYIKVAFREILELFLEDQNHPHLRNHALKEGLASYRSIDITENWRAIFKEVKSKTKKIIIFHMIGTHEQLYNK